MGIKEDTKNEGNLNYLRQVIAIREKTLEQLKLELPIIQKSIASIETSLEEARKELEELEKPNA